VQNTLRGVLRAAVGHWRSKEKAIGKDRSEGFSEIKTRVQGCLGQHTGEGALGRVVGRAYFKPNVCALLK